VCRIVDKYDRIGRSEFFGKPNRFEMIC